MSTNSISNLCTTISSYISDGECTITAEELANLFVDTDYYNAGQAGADQLQEQIDALEKVIQELVDEANDLNDSINDRQDDIDQKSNDLSDVVSSIAGEQIEYQIAVKNAARMAARDAVSAFQTDSSGSYETYFDQAFGSELNGIKGSMGTIKNLYADYQDIKGDLQDIFADIQNDVDEIDRIQDQLNTTNATINLLTITKNNMSSIIEGAYENCDTDTAKPIYSGAKAELANQLMATYAAELAETSGTSGSASGSSKTQAAVTSKWSAVATQADEYEYDEDGGWTKAKGGTPNNPEGWFKKSMYNPQLVSLSECIENGMLEELQAAGMSVNDIMTFISENWDVGIEYNEETGNWTIPDGHTADNDTDGTAVSTYNAIKALITNSTSYVTADDVDQDQMAVLKDAVENGDIITQLYKAGYTFKEAMYLLVQMFPDAGIQYDLEDQDGTRTYSIVSDNDESGSLYSTIAAQILEYWDVGATAATQKDDSTSGEVDSVDPITLQVGNLTYTFLSDGALNDGTFDYESGTDNDLMGSSDGISELVAYDWNEDGVIDDGDWKTDENGNIIYALDQITLLVNNQIESVSDSDDVDAYKDGSTDYTNTVDFDVSYTSARLAGITSINLTSLGSYDEDGNFTYNDDLLTSDNSDATGINGSDVINSFTVTMNGETYTAYQTDEKEDYLETIYGTIADNDTANAFSSIDQEEYEAAFDDWSNTDDLGAKDAYDNLTALKEQLEAQQDQIEDLLEAYGDDSDFAASYANFIKLVGTNGDDGEYINAVRNRAAEKSEAYKNDADNAADAAEEATYEVMEENFGSDTVEDVKAADKEDE